MTFHRATLPIIAIASFFSSTAFEALSQPAGVRGKSTIVSWSETRQMRRAGSSNWRSARIRVTVRNYVGIKGQGFTRVTLSGGRASGSHETVGRRVGSTAGGVRSTRWSGRTSTVTASTKSGGVRRLTIKYNGAFTGCGSRVIIAKRPGGRIVRVKSRASGHSVEILGSSWRISGAATCRIVNGNVFK